MNTFSYKHKKSSNYFEGWYLRITDPKNNLNFAFIFGITLEKKDPHSFIQIYDGTKLENTYYRFKVNEFKYENETVVIGLNKLSLSLLYIQVDSLIVDINLRNVDGLFPENSSAMGFLSRFPLQCFQEVNMMSGKFDGVVQTDNIDMSCKGTTYMEKTYGSKFPEKWIWIQSNHFKEDISVSFAYGKIPILFWKINGFMAILHYKGKEYRFASYNFSSLKVDNYKPFKVRITLQKKRVKLILDATMINPVKLVGPSHKGVMNLDVYESINSDVTVKLEINKEVVIDSVGGFSGLEIMN